MVCKRIPIEGRKIRRRAEDTMLRIGYPNPMVNIMFDLNLRDLQERLRRHLCEVGYNGRLQRRQGDNEKYKNKIEEIVELVGEYISFLNGRVYWKRQVIIEEEEREQSNTLENYFNITKEVMEKGEKMYIPKQRKRYKPRQKKVCKESIFES